jgi:hypothetical protein
MHTLHRLASYMLSAVSQFRLFNLRAAQILDGNLPPPLYV